MAEEENKQGKKGFFSWFRKDKKSTNTIDNLDKTKDEREIDQNKDLKTIDINTTTHIETTEQTTVNHNKKDQLAHLVDSENSMDIALMGYVTPVEPEDSVSTVDSNADVDSETIVDAVNAETSNEADEKTDNEPRTLKDEATTKQGFFKRLVTGLFKTKQSLGLGIFSLFSGRKINDELFEELEEQMIIADIGIPTTNKIIKNLIQHADKKQLKDADLLYSQLKQEMVSLLDPIEKPLDINTHKPFVILMVGVNGVGKTTTIGKLARQFQQQGKKVMLAAGDTFRAAAIEQLQVWGERNNIPVIAQQIGSDSASVIYDALESAKTRKYDVLIADTAGRLQNKDHLMNELKKIVRVMQKQDVNAPHEIMLVLDASTGQNAISQATLFNQAVGLTGITLTKLDGTAKGGVIFALSDTLKIPIRYIGIGEKIEDLRPFIAKDFIDAIFDEV